MSSRFGFATAVSTVGAWALIFVLVGCIDTRTMPVEYGPQEDANKILAAMNKPVENMKATDIKVGEFLAMETIQDVALGQSISAVGATGATIETRTEDNDRVVYSGTLKQLSLQSNGDFAKVFREGQILCASKTACACGECTTDTSGNQSSATSIIGTKAEPIAPQMPHKSLATESLKGYTDPVKLMSMAVATQESIVPTFHHFVTWVGQERPPANVASQPNCLDIPNCLINVTHVNFDEVFWDANPKGDRIHVELAMSPDVPYLSHNLSQCQTQMVKVGTDGSSVLLKQCTDVYDFRYGSQ